VSASYEHQLARAVQWYPGHMVRAMRRIESALALVDLVVETVDARVARSGSNLSLGKMASHKTRVVVLTRSDLADAATTRAWIEHYARRGLSATAVDARRRQGVTRIASLLGPKNARGAARAMIVGIPNSGKSSLVNSLLGRSSAKAENRAGITRRTQWFRLSPRIEIMDTPGVLPPKITSGTSQWKLAASGAIPSERYDAEEVARRLTIWAQRHGVPGLPPLESFAAARGFVRRGGKVDEHNAAQSYLRAFGDGKFGRISLESPDDEETAQSKD
jgi:ribosome biogenesis GTPase A